MSSEEKSSLEDYEKLRFISYSMSDNKWYIVKRKNINNDTYSFLNSGASGMVYVNKNIKRVVKIIRLSEDNDELIKEIKKAKQEATYQIEAAKYKLAPNIYFHGYIESKKSFLDNTTPYYYIIMDYLSPNEWDHIYGDEENIIDISEFVKILVENVGIINKIDPRLHFYKNKITNKIIMIDYDHCEKCDADKKNDCIRNMISAIKTNGGYRNRKTNRSKRHRSKRHRRKTHRSKRHRSKTHRSKTYRRKTHRTKTYKK